MKKSDTQFSALAPLLALGIVVILAIIVYRGYLTTAAMQPTVILPGGVTYLGK